nr:MAG TPA: hypothetical protein [Bacteriophage sp.]
MVLRFFPDGSSRKKRFLIRAVNPLESLKISMLLTLPEIVIKKMTKFLFFLWDVIIQLLQMTMEQLLAQFAME